MDQQKGTIDTLGTSTRTAEEFVRLLHLYHIELVADVRRYPASRFPHFQRDALSQALREAGLDYVYLGDDLGGYRSGGYQAYMLTEGFAKGLQRLEELAAQKRVTILCAERLPWRCHRRFIAFELERRGWEVVHIIDEKRTWQPKAQETADRQ